MERGAQLTSLAFGFSAKLSAARERKLSERKFDGSRVHKIIVARINTNLIAWSGMSAYGAKIAIYRRRRKNCGKVCRLFQLEVWTCVNKSRLHGWDRFGRCFWEGKSGVVSWQLLTGKERERERDLSFWREILGQEKRGIMKRWPSLTAEMRRLMQNSRQGLLGHLVTSSHFKQNRFTLYKRITRTLWQRRNRKHSFLFPKFFSCSFQLCSTIYAKIWSHASSCIQLDLNVNLVRANK